ncbi:class I SAM-dependent methyltransferase [Rhodococcus erythropolis]|uniref:SAM-dependent methyltransferase n=1 Tax=Rhodococcus TaxID=1827 RepID=UPI0015F5044A|nr:MULTISPECIES: cyclopropane-fatty-acyl-phospholipid synthase family protein [Rhodococcus]MBY6384390.1 class I SAM-dependent methyltransferase [Rhodococcus erythropolis]MCS4254909.1 cyclopropane-fatty-acyl-phospholipid synthase [Rhodococcus erythropolis]MCW2430993.1 cyclopropane-fatty-acyl-phospholipid synthase [Rhodococcus erythropolis]
MTGAATKILTVFEEVIGVPLPVRVRCWDGSEAGPPDAAARVHFRNRRALRRVLYSPNELGLARAYVSGDLDVDGDIFALLDVPDLVTRLGENRLSALPLRSLVRAAGTFAGLGAVGPPPSPPSIEMRRKRGKRHSKSRDSATVSHHYDVGNRFYEMFLGPSMVYSCGYWPEGVESLEAAQYAKLDLICRKLDLKPGMRLLDVGCGWGSMALHAAQNYGVDVVGVSLSNEQVEYAKGRVADAGLADRIEIRVQDYRDVDDGPYDAISSIGMSEHVGLANLPVYTAKLYDLLAPQGRLLNHAIAAVKSLSDNVDDGRSFIDRYIFPDGEILPLSKTIDALELSGFETRDSEALREHYALTLRAWVQNLRENWDASVLQVGAPRVRTWLLYLAASALGFEEPHRLTIHQVLAVKPGDRGASGMARSRSSWYRSIEVPQIETGPRVD